MAITCTVQIKGTFGCHLYNCPKHGTSMPLRRPVHQFFSCGHLLYSTDKKRACPGNLNPDFPAFPAFVMTLLACSSEATSLHLAQSPIYKVTGVFQDRLGRFDKPFPTSCKSSHSSCVAVMGRSIIPASSDPIPIAILQDICVQPPCQVSDGLLCKR